MVSKGRMVSHGWNGVNIYQLSAEKEDRCSLGPSLIRAMDPGSPQYHTAINVYVEDLAKGNIATIVANCSE